MKKIKLFLDPFDSIGPLLNSISAQGYRLKSVWNFIYEFEKTEEKYSYSTQFIGADSVKNNKRYMEMLEDSNLKIFRAPINQGNIAFGKFRLRPYVKGVSKVSSTFGDLNKEILILENKGENPEKLLSNNIDISTQYKSIRNAYIQGFVVLVGLVLMLYFKNRQFQKYKLILGIIVGIYLLYKIISNHGNYKKYKDLSEILE